MNVKYWVNAIISKFGNLVSFIKPVMENFLFLDWPVFIININWHYKGITINA